MIAHRSGTGTEVALRTRNVVHSAPLRLYHSAPVSRAPPDRYVNRALWRWARNRQLDGGRGQYTCSQCAGRVTTNAKTHHPDVVPNKTAPFLRTEDEYCCEGMVSIPVDKLDSVQDIPSGTPAWKKSYGRRNPSEKTISMIKDKGGLTPGWCRAFGLAAHTIGALALAITHNLKQTLRGEKTKTESPTAPARPKNFEPARRNVTADSLTPRAPPG